MKAITATALVMFAAMAYSQTNRLAITNNSSQNLELEVTGRNVLNMGQDCIPIITSQKFYLPPGKSVEFDKYYTSNTNGSNVKLWYVINLKGSKIYDITAEKLPVEVSTKTEYNSLRIKSTNWPDGEYLGIGSWCNGSIPPNLVTTQSYNGLTATWTQNPQDVVVTIQ